MDDSRVAAVRRRRDRPAGRRRSPRLAAGRLSARSFPDVARVAPWLAPFEPWFSASDPRPRAELDLQRLCALARERGITIDSGAPLRFVDAAAAGGAAYESFVFETGCVPTRSSGPGMLHDWFNALCWLRWPAIKSRLNRLQADAIGARGIIGARGPLRDAITSFDESGALLVCGDEQLIARWRRFDWHGLFVANRAAFMRDVRVLIVGHALLEKLVDPYKGICAQALAVTAPGQTVPFDERRRPGEGDRTTSIDSLDRLVAATITADSFGRDRFAPLPLLGVPGWWPGNEDPKFYNDPDVFRQDRQRRSHR